MSVGSNSHYAERGCVRSISRSALKCLIAWCCLDVLRLVGTTQSALRVTMRTPGQSAVFVRLKTETAGK